jgi:hypothetical protein
MKFQGSVIESYPDGVTLAVEVRVEAEDGDAARPVADAAMAALEARRLWQGVTRRVVPVALVKDEPTTAAVFHVYAIDGVADDDGMRRDSRE